MEWFDVITLFYTTRIAATTDNARTAIKSKCPQYAKVQQCSRTTTMQKKKKAVAQSNVNVCSLPSRTCTFCSQKYC